MNLSPTKKKKLVFYFIHILLSKQNLLYLLNGVLRPQLFNNPFDS